LNGGSCIVVSNSFVCKCIGGYDGTTCNRKVLNSTIFKNSTILSQSDSLTLKNLLDFSNSSSFSLIYQATRDGFGINSFHSNVNGSLNTLMVIKTTDSFVFGGFTTKDWATASDIGYVTDSNAFLFSLINSFNNPVKMPINQPQNAIFEGTNDDFSIVYGFGENDIILSDNSNLIPNYAWSTTPYSFDLPSFVDNNGTLLNGANANFLAYEIEVFTVDCNYFYFTFYFFFIF
jgi:hypothetical protein